MYTFCIQNTLLGNYLLFSYDLYTFGMSVNASIISIYISNRERLCHSVVRDLKNSENYCYFFFFFLIVYLLFQAQNGASPWFYSFQRVSA